MFACFWMVYFFFFLLFIGLAFFVSDVSLDFILGFLPFLINILLTIQFFFEKGEKNKIKLKYSLTFDFQLFISVKLKESTHASKNGRNLKIEVDTSEIWDEERNMIEMRNKKQFYFLSNFLVSIYILWLIIVQDSIR